MHGGTFTGFWECGTPVTLGRIPGELKLAGDVVEACHEVLCPRATGSSVSLWAKPAAYLRRLCLITTVCPTSMSSRRALGARDLTERLGPSEAYAGVARLFTASAVPALRKIPPRLEADFGDDMRKGPVIGQSPLRHCVGFAQYF